ncbi:MAG: rhomboid family intramembrane serine protease [Gemmatimonadaceae bacterium]
MIPIGDDLPTLRRPIVTYAIIAATAAAWLLFQGAGFNPITLAGSLCNLGLVPGELSHRAPLGLAVPLGYGLQCVVDNEPINWLTPVTSMFLHGSWGHILGNLLFFYVFGNNVEDSMGHARFAIFYLICGLAAAAVHVLFNPTSPVPTVGASGAISGVMGAYLMLYPRARIKMLFPFLIIFPVLRIQAWLVLLWWFAWQVVAWLPELTSMRREVSGGVAVGAHVGGFLAGVLLIRLFANPRLVDAHHTTYGDNLGYRWRRGQ